jgi:hypothetical protein
MTLTAPPHASQVEISILNTRFKRCAFMPSGAAHGGMLLYRRSLVAGYLASDALASFGWRYQGTVLAIRLMRHCDEHAVESGQVSPGLRHQSSKPSDEIQWLEDDVGSTIFIRSLQLIANVAA